MTNHQLANLYLLLQFTVVNLSAIIYYAASFLINNNNYIIFRLTGYIPNNLFSRFENYEENYM